MPARSGSIPAGPYPAAASSATSAGRLAAAALERQAAAVHQPRRGLGQQPPVDLESVRAGHRRQPRLVLGHLRLQVGHLPLRHVGRVRDDQPEAVTRHLREQVGEVQLDVQAQPRRVGGGHVERILGDVAGDHLSVRALGLERQRDRAGAGADVDDARALDALQQLQAAVDEQLRLGARHQHPRIDREIETAEAPAADHVGHRLAQAAAPHQLPAGGQLVVVERALVLGVELDPGKAEAVSQQQLGVEARGRAAVLLEVAGGAAEHLRQADHAAAAASFRRRSSADRASVNGPRLPASTLSRLCTVRLMRWSVTRFCG